MYDKYHIVFSEDNIPSWEKRFCALIGKVPWRKIVDTKKFAFCYGNVVDWNDSAAEEAFHNAKKRFWEKMNGFYCEISLPDPDTYIDDIDWSPDIDPQLIKELELEYFPPDDEEQNDEVMGRNKKTRSSVCVPQDELNKNVDEHGNPWECQYGQVSGGAFQSKTNGWSQWNNATDSSKILDNPWESINTHENGHKKGNGWNSMESNVNQSSDWNNDVNAWHGGCHGLVSTNDNKWNNSWNQSSGWNQPEYKNTGNANDLWGHGFGQDSRGPKERGSRNGGDAGYWRQRDHYNNQKNNFEFRSGGGRGSWNEDYPKRKGYHHSSYRNSRFQKDENQTGYCWRGNNKKRLS